jgi:hypothetical protein
MALNCKDPQPPTLQPPESSLRGHMDGDLSASDEPHRLSTGSTLEFSYSTSVLIGTGVTTIEQVSRVQHGRPRAVIQFSAITSGVQKSRPLAPSILFCDHGASIHYHYPFNPLKRGVYSDPGPPCFLTCHES